jgi:hypothetical protein
MLFLLYLCMSEEFTFKEFWNSLEKKPKGIAFSEDENISPECVDFKYLRRSRKLVRDYRDILNQSRSDKKWRLVSERMFRGHGSYVTVYVLAIKDGREVLDQKKIQFITPPLVPKRYI